MNLIAEQELMRKYAWCQFMASAMASTGYREQDKILAAADAALAEYDKRWPKENV